MGLQIMHINEICANAKFQHVLQFVCISAEGGGELFPLNFQIRAKFGVPVFKVPPGQYQLT